MNDQDVLISQVFSCLAGTWIGEGRGEYPGITSFDYREMLIYTRRDEKSLAYQQQTYKRYSGQTEYLVSHWENGFIRVVENGTLEMVNTQSSGRGEVAIGKAEVLGNLFRIHFASKTLTNDTRVVYTERSFELEGDTLRSEMQMQTTKVDRLTRHLHIALQRVK